MYNIIQQHKCQMGGEVHLGPEMFNDTLNSWSTVHALDGLLFVCAIDKLTNKMLE